MKKIRIIIDVFETEDGYNTYRITDTSGNPANFCLNGGWVYYSDNVDDIIQNARNEYQIEIVEDYRPE
tara:strand:- start:452 stop:655 length:204 start_codon:yes stop_codon:yes gene_type:complete